MPTNAFIASTVLTALATAACTQGQLVAPSQTSPAASTAAPAPLSGRTDAIITLKEAPATFDLSGGTFGLTFANGQLSGIYSGQVDQAAGSGRVTSSLTLTVQTGIGVFEGARGTLAGSGSGAFLEPGDFTLTLEGDLTTASDPISVKTRARGTTALSCSAPNVVVTLTGTGRLGKIGDFEATFSHVAPNAGCGP